MKKISTEQFIFDCIKKQFEVIGATDVPLDSFDEFRNWTAYHEEWYQEYSFVNESQYEEVKNYFIEHWDDAFRKSTPKYQRLREFSWFMLNYGLAD